MARRSHNHRDVFSKPLALAAAYWASLCTRIDMATAGHMLRRQPRLSRGSLERPLLFKASQLRSPEACLRVSRCVPVDRLVVGAIFTDAPSRGTSLASWQRSLPRWPPQAPTVQFRSDAVTCELKLLREPLPHGAVRVLGACYQPEVDTTVTGPERSLAPTARHHCRCRQGEPRSSPQTSVLLSVFAAGLTTLPNFVDKSQPQVGYGAPLQYRALVNCSAQSPMMD